METQTTPRSPKNEGPGISLRLVVMGFIVFVLWIASMAVDSQVSDRERNKGEAETEISSRWGGEQLVGGPLAVLPWIKEEVVESEGEKGRKIKTIVRSRHTALWLPETLKAEVELIPEIRSRGIFQTVVYVSKVRLRGRLKGPDLKALDVNAAGAQWDKAYLSIGIDDVQGIRSAGPLQLGKASLDLKPGPGADAPWGSGMRTLAALPRQTDQGMDFDVSLEINGSKNFWVLPAGRQSEVAMRSTWPDPSFNGSYLPIKREVTPQGFTSEWQVPELARSFPSAWVDNDVNFEAMRKNALGVGLIKTVSTYQQASRATKYAVLFILLTFTAFFLFEVFNRLKVHPIQYLLVGSALVVFYLLLLSLSEHLGFDGAYALSTAMTMLPVSVYLRSVLADRNRALVLVGLLLGLYAYLYIILRLNDYALLMGSLAIFAALSTAMILTRKIDWSRLEPR